MARRKLAQKERNRVEWILKYCTNEPDKLSESTLDFLISIEAQYKRDGMLSDTQLEALESIYERMT